MKRLILTAALAGLALAGCSKKEEAAAPPAAEAAAMAPAAPAADSMAGMQMAPDAKMARSSGTVTAVAADGITIDHAAIPEANWPAMTMAFKASPDLAKSVKVGDKVNFDLKLERGSGEITAIARQ